MKLTYQGPAGKLEFGAFINDETGAPTYILTLFGNSTVLDENSAKLLKQYIPDDIEHSAEIIECKNPIGVSKNLKKSVDIVIKDAINPYKITDKNSWIYFTTYVLKVAEFVRQLYNAMGTEQQRTPEAQKLNRLLVELGV